MNEASNAGSIAVPPTRSERWLLAAVVVVGLLVSGIIAKDRLTWLLEVIWAMVGLALVAWKWNAFPLTRLLCWLLALHAPAGPRAWPGSSVTTCVPVSASSRLTGTVPKPTA